VEVSQDYTLRMLAKSEEEIALYRWGSKVGEKACEAMMEAVRPGASEHHIFSEVMRVLFEHGCFAVAPHLNMTIGLNDLGWGHPMWAYRGGRPRTVGSVDLVQAEIFPCYGGIECQQQMAITVGSVPRVIDELADVARRSHDAGLERLRPGIKFGELLDVMEAPLAKADCWHLTPLVHTLSPVSRMSATALRIEQLPGVGRYKGIRSRPPVGADMLIEHGMVFAFEPNACKAEFRVNIGGTVVVTANGAEPLNEAPNRLHRTR
jgi:Xaa-Pro aminopeptidase